MTLSWPEVALPGTVAVICTAESTLKVALAPLKVTDEAELKFVPLITTLVPATPFAGEKPVMTGGGLVWPSTLFSSAAATSDGRAVKNAKPVSN